ncbi:MAG: hypothetical protein ACOH5I_25135 [Oligoflexus sp.]
MDPDALPQVQQLKSDIKHHSSNKHEMRGEVKVDEKDSVKDVALKVPEINANA